MSKKQRSSDGPPLVLRLNSAVRPRAAIAASAQQSRIVPMIQDRTKLPLPPGHTIETLQTHWERDTRQENTERVQTLLEPLILLIETGLANADPQSKLSMNSEIENIFSHLIKTVKGTTFETQTDTRNGKRRYMWTSTIQWLAKKSYSVYIPSHLVKSHWKTLGGDETQFDTEGTTILFKFDKYAFARIGKKKEMVQWSEKQIPEGDLVIFSSIHKSCIKKICALFPSVDPEIKRWKTDNLLLSEVQQKEVSSDLYSLEDFFFTYAEQADNQKVMLTSLLKYVSTVSRTLPGLLMNQMIRDLKRETPSFGAKRIIVSNDAWKSQDRLWDSNILKDYADWLLRIIEPRLSLGHSFLKTLTDLTTDIILCKQYGNPKTQKESDYLLKLLKRCFRGLALRLNVSTLMQMLSRIKKYGFYGQYNMQTESATPLDKVVAIAASFTDMTLL